MHNPQQDGTVNVFVIFIVIVTLLCLLVRNLVAQDLPQVEYDVEVKGKAPKEQCVTMQVRPRFMLPLSRTDVRVELRIKRHADHDAVVLKWDGGFAGAGGSGWGLNGEEEEYLHVKTIRELAASNWVFVAAVFDKKGKILGTATEHIIMPEVNK